MQKALDTLIWSERQTVVLVAHRLSTVINAHTIVVVDKGRAAEQGNHQQLLEINGTYAALVAHQVQRQREQISEDKDAVADAALGKGGTGASSSYGDGIDALFERTTKAAGNSTAASGDSSK